MRLNMNKGVSPYILVKETAASAAVIIHALPALSHVMEQAKADAEIFALAQEIRAELKEGEEPTAELMQSRGTFSVLFAKAIAKQVIQSWDGIEDEDGTPAPVTPDRVEALLDLAPIYEAFVSVYMSRWLVLQAEKNDSAPSPTGTSEAAPNTAVPAQDDATSVPAS